MCQGLQIDVNIYLFKKNTFCLLVLLYLIWIIYKFLTLESIFIIFNKKRLKYAKKQIILITLNDNIRIKSLSKGIGQN